MQEVPARVSILVGDPYGPIHRAHRRFIGLLASIPLVGDPYGPIHRAHRRFIGLLASIPLVGDPYGPIYRAHRRFIGLWGGAITPKHAEPRQRRSEQ